MSRIIVVLVSLLAFGSAPAAAAQEARDGAPAVAEPLGQSPPVTPAPAAQQTGGGLPERAPQARTMRAYWHVFVAFAVTWLLLFGYALTVGRRFGHLEDEIRRLAAAGDQPRV
jgi:CcmD family protein